MRKKPKSQFYITGIMNCWLHATCMLPKKILPVYLSMLFIICGIFNAYTQTIEGHVIDTSGKPLPFATIKFAHSKEGLIADLKGKFSFHLQKQKETIEVSYLNHKTSTLEVTSNTPAITIVLLPNPSTLDGVIVTTTSTKLKRILNTTIANRHLHNPDKYDWYRCYIYYKMIASMNVPDSLLKKDTSSNGRFIKKMMEEQYLLVSETYSRRTWQKPARLQDEVIASRLSGFQKPFTALVTDVLPFHSYNDFILLNGKEMKNPLSKGLFQHFNFKLADEILQGKDTVWVINFTPKKLAAELQGTVFIHSDGFAIKNLIAQSIDTSIHRTLGIEQQYIQHDGRWFPNQLNYSLTWKMANIDNMILYMNGISVIDSVNWQRDSTFKFDRAHTTKMLPTAHLVKDSNWQHMRPIELQPKEARTFVVMDSLSKGKGFDRLLNIGEKLVENKFAIKMFDINLDRIYSVNPYEQSRMGWGMQTNEKVSKHFSIGAWAGYGTGDKAWKYGALGELYLDEYKEFVARAEYYNDLRDPGRLQIHKELDKSYLRMFMLTRVDNVVGWNISLTKKLGYLSAEIRGGQESITPRYNYAFEHRSKTFTSYKTKEITMNLRYAFGETTAPVFGRYYSSGTKYPVLYARIISGVIDNADIQYTQALAAISWTKNINGVGKEKLLLVAGTTLGNQPLPISKLFAGNGFNTAQRPVYIFGGMVTMRPYDYYADKFVNLYWMHDLPNALFRAKITKQTWSMAPTPGIGHNILWGSMQNRDAHKEVAFAVPDNAYHESGLMINQLLRMKMMNLLYATINAGYFYHWTNKWDAMNGRFVIGLSATF